MPTGYTADIYENKGVTFRDYALGCARAFGALILMRDAPKDAPIPRGLEPSLFSRNELDKAAQRVRDLLAMTSAEREQAATKEYTEAVVRWQKNEVGNLALKKRYEDMLVKARQFVAPTPQHQAYAEFLVEQLEESLKFDCHEPGDEWYKEPVKISGEEWYARELAKATSNVNYYGDEWKKELERTEGRNAWIKGLFEALDSMEET